jgi:hypothetical protein
MRYSRATLWAVLLTSLPGGFLRTTKEVEVAEVRR